MMSPVRIVAPVFGSTTPAVLICAIFCGADHVVPPSVDLTNATFAFVFTTEFGWTIQSVTS